MLKTLKGKILCGVLLTSVIIMVITDLIIWKVFENNLHSFIKNDMDKLKTVVLSEITMRYPVSNQINLVDDKIDIWSIFNNMNSVYGIYASIHNDNGEHIFAGEVLDEAKINEIIEEDNKVSSILYINQEDRTYYATYTYPFYISQNYNGTIVFQKNYFMEFTTYGDLIKSIAMIQIMLYVIMLTVMYILLKKATSPLKALTNAMATIEKGDYSKQINIKSKDEVATLITQFNKMQIKILAQMEHLKLEKDKIEELEKSQRNFFNYATHELKTPITSIKGYIGILQGGDVEQEVIERAYDRIWIESERMHTMIQNILMVAKGSQIYRKEPEYFDLKQLTQDVIEELGLIYSKFDMNIVMNDGEQVMIHGVKDEIRTIVLNLVNNAVKYSNDKNIKITCSNNKPKFMIENRCLPIPSELKNKLLDPFVKYNYEDYTKVSSGLGLFICKELADRNSIDLAYYIDEGKIRFELNT